MHEWSGGQPGDRIQRLKAGLRIRVVGGPCRVITRIGEGGCAVRMAGTSTAGETMHSETLAVHDPAGPPGVSLVQRGDRTASLGRGSAGPRTRQRELSHAGLIQRGHWGCQGRGGRGGAAARRIRGHANAAQAGLPISAPTLLRELPRDSGP